MRCRECGHWNSCPRCTDYVCELCGEELEILETDQELSEREILNDTIRRQLDVD
jgi:hypothetical protein